MELPHSLLNVSNSAKPSAHNVFQCSSPLQVQHSENSWTLGSPSCSKALSNCRAKFFEVAFRLSKDGGTKMKGMSALLMYRSVLFDHYCSRMLAQWNHLLTRFDKTWMIDKSRPDRGQVTLAVPVCVGWILTLHRNMHNGWDIFIKKLKIPWPKSVQILQAVIRMSFILSMAD